MRDFRINFSYEKLYLDFDITKRGKLQRRTTSLLPIDIYSITFEPCKERVLLKEYLSERIIIRSKKLVTPIIYYGIKEYAWYDNYKNGLRKFAIDNNIQLIDKVTL